MLGNQWLEIRIYVYADVTTMIGKKQYLLQLGESLDDLEWLRFVLENSISSSTRDNEDVEFRETLMGGFDVNVGREGESLGRFDMLGFGCSGKLESIGSCLRC